MRDEGKGVPSAGSNRRGDGAGTPALSTKALLVALCAGLVLLTASATFALIIHKVSIDVEAPPDGFAGLARIATDPASGSASRPNCAPFAVTRCPGPVPSSTPSPPAPSPASARSTPSPTATGPPRRPSGSAGSRSSKTPACRARSAVSCSPAAPISFPLRRPARRFRRLRLPQGAGSNCARTAPSAASTRSKGCSKAIPGSPPRCSTSISASTTSA